MKYILNEDYGLRSWMNAFFGLVKRGTPGLRVMPPENFFVLTDCDGGHELESSVFLDRMQVEGIVRPALPGERLSGWQQYWDYDNYFFQRLCWMLTGRCNYNCRHCFNAADKAPLTSWWSWDEAQCFMDEMRDCGIQSVMLTGGEPMLHPRFMDIVRGIHARGMIVDKLNTNGHFITREVLDELKSFGCMPEMKISFDGLGHHDWMRGCKGAEERALEAICLCVENGFEVLIQMNVHRGNVECILPTLEKLDAMGVQHTRLIRTSESPRWMENAHGMTLGLQEYFDTMLDMARGYSAKPHRMHVRAWQFADLFPAEQCYSPYMDCFAVREYRDALPVCMLNRNMISVTAEGEAVPCLQMSGYYEAHAIHLGNVKEAGLQRILRDSDYLRSVCQTLGDLKTHNETCAACEHYSRCRGGCRALALAMTGDMNGIDPTKCLFFRDNYEEKLQQALPGWTNRNV